MSDLTLPDQAHALLICEGTFEQYLVETLLNENKLIVTSDAVIGVTRTRSAAQIQEQYLSYDYDWPLVILRVLDSRPRLARRSRPCEPRYLLTVWRVGYKLAAE